MRFSQLFSFHPTGPVPCHSTQFFIRTRSAILYFLDITTNTTHGTAQHSSGKISKMCAYAVHSGPLHQITKYNGNCKKQISHQSNTNYFASIFFLINSTDQDLHRTSIFRVYVLMLDISIRTIYSFIYYVKL